MDNSVDDKILSEDLRKWLRQQWVDISRTKKGGGHPPCGASSGSKSRAGGKRAYPKCVPASKASSMSDTEKKSAVRRKRDKYKGKGTPAKKAVNVKTDVDEGKKDACYHKVKARYKVWPSAYASLALSKCRKKGAANWGNSKKEESMIHENMEEISICQRCAIALLEDIKAGLFEAEYQGRTVQLNKPMKGDVKKFKVYVKKGDNVVKVNFGDPNMRIKKSDPARRRSFRARHRCDTPGPKHKARYWSCRKW